MSRDALEARRRTEWESLRRQGLWRHLFVRGVLLRGLPMALAIMVLIETLRGTPLGRSTWTDPVFLGRLALATLLFSLGGIFSAWARWKALAADYEAKD